MWKQSRNLFTKITPDSNTHDKNRKVSQMFSGKISNILKLRLAAFHRMGVIPKISLATVCQSSSNPEIRRKHPDNDQYYLPGQSSLNDLQICVHTIDRITSYVWWNSEYKAISQSTLFPSWNINLVYSLGNNGGQFLI